jgi:hypothetical protein
MHRIAQRVDSLCVWVYVGGREVVVDNDNGIDRRYIARGCAGRARVWRRPLVRAWLAE